MSVSTAAASPVASMDARFMALALALGRRGLGRTWPNPAVGAVLVCDDADGPIILGRGWTQPGGRPHAEVDALCRAGDTARRSTLYVTLEPCSHHGKSPPCADAIVAAGVTRVVSALEDPNPDVAGQGHTRLREAGIIVDVGEGAEAARQAHAGHIRRITEGRPHVTLKLAVSVDGKAGLAGRRPAAITGESARDRVHLMRAMNDAILVGVGTVRADDPQLTCRLPGMAERSPVRVVLDAALSLPLSSRLVQSVGATPVWVMAGSAAPQDREQALREAGVEVLRVADADGRLDLAAALQALAARGITRLMVEGGPIVAASFLTADLVDEAVLCRAETAIGPDGIDAIEGHGLDLLTRSPRLTRISREAIGPDWIEHYKRV